MIRPGKDKAASTAAPSRVPPLNAITGSGNPMDDHYHGTHVAGTIGTAGNNGIGVVGVDLVGVGETVAIGVGLSWVAVVLVFLKVGQPVAVIVL